MKKIKRTNDKNKPQAAKVATKPSHYKPFRDDRKLMSPEEFAKKLSSDLMERIDKNVVID